MGLFVGMQHVLPQHLFSRVVLAATRIRVPLVKDALIGAFLKGYSPDMGDAIEPDPHAYGSFNDFFTRALRDGARPIAAGTDVLASPVDGTVSQAGPIKGNQIFQAKGHEYSLEALLAGAAAEWAPAFRDGSFATIYLAPYNYHRIHMPLEGTLRETWFVPGRLFSVNAATAAGVPGLFARNERLVCLFDGPAGPYAVILVGALFVGSMGTVWHGDALPHRSGRPFKLPLNPTGAALTQPKGAELGRFNMGSTVILLFGKDRAELLSRCVNGKTVRMGEALGRMRTDPAAT
ncbi:MAG: phosphatidylserine decarboxylase [Pseudomonadota bacterium]|jgi:phosphatidylserine decarboxylase